MPICRSCCCSKPAMFQTPWAQPIYDRRRRPGFLAKALQGFPPAARHILVSNFGVDFRGCDRLELRAASTFRRTGAKGGTALKPQALKGFRSRASAYGFSDLGLAVWASLIFAEDSVKRWSSVCVCVRNWLTELAGSLGLLFQTLNQGQQRNQYRLRVGLLHRRSSASTANTKGRGTLIMCVYMCCLIFDIFRLFNNFCKIYAAVF